MLQKGSEPIDGHGDSGDEKPNVSSANTAAGTNISHWRKRLLQKVQSALISSLEIGDEKLQLVQSMQDVVENKSRQLEADCKALGTNSNCTHKYQGIYYIVFQNAAEFHKEREPAENSKESSMRDSGTGGNHSSHSNSAGERQSKRARRSKPENVSTLKRLREVPLMNIFYL